MSFLFFVFSSSVALVFFLFQVYLIVVNATINKPPNGIIDGTRTKAWHGARRIVSSIVEAGTDIEKVRRNSPLCSDSSSAARLYTIQIKNGFTEQRQLESSEERVDKSKIVSTNSANSSIDEI